MGANTKDSSNLTGLILARRRRRRLTNDLLVKSKPSDAAPAVFGDLYFDAPAAGGNYTLTAQGGAYTLAGQQAVLERDRNLTASGGAYSISGQQAIIERDRRLTASGGSYSLAGQQVTLTKSTAANNYVLTAQGGSYSLTGQSATIERDRRLTASGGSYSVTGQQIILLRTKRIVATGGSYVLTGQAANLLRSKRIIASGGAYAVAGQQVNITFAPAANNYVLTAQGGIYEVTGASADLQYAVAVKAGGYDDEKPAKKRFIVEKNGKLMVFNTAQAALDAQPKKKKVQPVEVDVPEQVAEVIELPAVKEYAQVIGQIEQYNAAYNSQHFEKLIALFEQMREEDDIEALLLSIP